MKKETDDLADRICQGDTSAFKELVDMYKKKVYYIAYDVIRDHHEAEDISQEVFIKVYRSLNNFKRDSKMSSWIYQIAVNTSIDVLRRKKTKPQVNLEDWEQNQMLENPPGLGSKANNPEKNAEGSLLQDQIHQALNKVTARERSAFIMRHYNEFTIDEIAEVLGISSGAVKSFLFRVVRKLRKELSSYRAKAILEAGYE